MKYTIISLNDDRLKYKTHIRDTVKGCDEIFIPATNGREVNLDDELAKRGLHIPHRGIFSVGEVGIWLSVWDCWQWCVNNKENLIVFEDDAIPRHYFDEAVHKFLLDIPDGWDYLCLWVPDNQKQDYWYNVTYDDEGLPTINGTRNKSLFDFGGDYLAKAYNGYGNVATMFSPRGAEHLMNIARQAGLYTPVDCFLYQEAHAGRCEGYSPQPAHATVVDYDWPETTVHTTERYHEVYG